MQEQYERKNGRFVSAREQQKLEQEIEKAQIEDSKARKDIERLKAKSNGDSVFSVVLQHIEENHQKSLKEAGYVTPVIPKAPKDPSSEIPAKPKKKGYLVDELSRMPDKQRKLVSRIYDVIARNLPPEQSEELISKIQEELKNAKKSSAD